MNLSLKFFGREVFSVGKSTSVASLAFMRGDDAGEGGGAQLTSAYQQSTWVYACVSAIAQQVAQIPFRFSRTARVPMKQRSGAWRRKAIGEDIVESGPVVQLFERPHPHLNRYQFWELLVSWLQLRGEWFAVPMDNAFGLSTRPTQLAVLSPDQFREDVRGNMLIGWRYQGSDGQSPAPTMMLLPEDVLTDRLANPFDFWRGQSPLSVARLAAQSDYASAQFEKGLMLNNADTGVIVTTDQQVEETQREAILAALKDRKRKAGTADRPLFLWGGAKIEKPTLSSADMQFLEGRRFKVGEICAVFKVPVSIVLGDQGAGDRRVIDSPRLYFLENNIAPLCERIEAALDPFIKAQDRGLWGWFDVESLPIMQAARRERYATAAAAFSMGVPIDECSEIFDLGLPDDLPHAGKSYLPFSLQEVGQAEPAPQPPAAPPAEDQPQQNLFARAGKLLAGLGSHGTAIPTHQCTLSPEGYYASIRGSVKKKTGSMQKFFFEQRGRVLAAVETELGRASTPLRAAAGNGVPALPKGLDDIFNLLDENVRLLAKFKPLLLGDLEFGGAQLFKEIGAENFAVKPQAALDFLAARKNEIENVNRFTFEALKQTLGDGLSQGETTPELTARVKSVFKDATERRAETIALTETNIAINAGRFEAMKTAKVDGKAWLASNLAGSRATHQQAGRDYADGIPVDQAFRVGGEDLMFPGDPKGSPGNVINCRCTSIAVKGGKACVPPLWLAFEEWAAAREGSR